MKVSVDSSSPVWRLRFEAMRRVSTILVDCLRHQKLTSTAAKRVYLDIIATVRSSRNMLRLPPVILKALTVLEAWTKRMTHQECPIYAIQAVLMAVWDRASIIKLERRHAGQQMPSARMHAAYKAKVTAVLRAATLATAGEKQSLCRLLPPPPRFALDIHTNHGRRTGSSLTKFAAEGTVVVAEAHRVSQLLRAYNCLKVFMDAGWVQHDDHPSLARIISAVNRVSREDGTLLENATLEPLPSTPTAASSPVSGKRRRLCRGADRVDGCANNTSTGTRRAKASKIRIDDSPFVRTTRGPTLVKEALAAALKAAGAVCPGTSKATTKNVPVEMVASAIKLAPGYPEETFVAAFRAEHAPKSVVSEALLATLGDRKSVVVAQRCTSKHKPPTKITGRLVVKGPYTVESRAVRLVQYRTSRLLAWGAEPTTVPVSIQRDEATGYQYLVFPVLPGSIARRCQNVVYYQWHLPRGSPAMRPGVGYVAVRHPSDAWQQGSELVKSQFDSITDAMWLATFQHLLLRFVLGCGDSGLWNMLMCPSRDMVYGFDLEDVRKQSLSDASTVLRAMFPSRSVPKAFVQRLKAKIRSLVAALTSWLRSRHQQARSSSLPPTATEERRWVHLLRLLESGSVCGR